MRRFYIQTVDGFVHEVFEKSEAAAIQTLATSLDVSPHLLEVVR